MVPMRRRPKGIPVPTPILMLASLGEDGNNACSLGPFARNDPCGFDVVEVAVMLVGPIKVEGTATDGRVISPPVISVFAVSKSKSCPLGFEQRLAFGSPGRSQIH